MIRIDMSRTIAGTMVYGDSEQVNVFYLLPDAPRFRIDDAGHPVFKLLKYRTPVTNNDGTVGGGFVIFDSEFVVADDTLQKITKQLADELSTHKPPLQPEFRKLSFVKGTAQLHLLDSGGALVQKILSSGAPSLYGNNIASFTAELSSQGATLAVAAFQGAGGVAQVMYDLYFSAALGPITGVVHFNASKSYSFLQQITHDSHWYSSSQSVTNNIQEALISTSSGGVDFDFSALGNMPDQDEAEKIKTQIRQWGTQALEDAIKNQIPPDIAPQDDRSDPGYDNFTRNINVVHLSNVYQSYRENEAVQWHVVPNGTLPNITSMQGGKLKWSDYYQEVNLDDPFFKKLRVKAYVNADFQKFPIQSVDLHLEYSDGTTNTASDLHITAPDQVLSLEAYLGASNKYTYSAIVNYKDSDYVYNIPPTQTEKGALTIDVGDLGLLYVAVGTGAINFNEVSEVQVTMKYQDPSHNVSPIQEEFVIDKNNKSYQFQHVLKAPWTNPYTYDLLYVMTDGKKWQKTGLSSQSQELFINDPFADTRNISVVATGDLDADVANIFLTLQYDDDQNNYHIKANPTTLNKSNPFFQWAVPVIDPTAGKVSYSAQIVYKKGPPDSIALTTAKSDSIFVGPVDQMQVVVDPSALDFTGPLKFVKITVHYADPAHQVDLKRDILLKPATQPQTWVVDLRDKSKTQFDWQATYYVTGPNGAITPQLSPLTTVTDGGQSSTLLVMPPS